MKMVLNLAYIRDVRDDSQVLTAGVNKFACT